MAAAAPLRAALRLSTTKKIARTFGATAPPLPPPEGLASAKINTTATNHPIPSSRNLGKAIKDTGRELRQVALTEDCVSDVQNALYSVHRTVVPLSKTMHPVINGNDIFIAPNSSIIGDVFVGEGTGVWYGAVVRGDLSKVTIGAKCNIGDKTIINTVPTSSEGDGSETDAIPFPSRVKIGNYVSIGGGTVIAGDCELGNFVKIGEAVKFDVGVVVGDGASVESGSLVPRGTYIPPGENWGGDPLKYVGPSDEGANQNYAEQMEVIRDDHIHEFLPFGAAYQHLEELQGGQL